METITKTFNIYNFDELKTEIQEALIEKEAENIREAEIEDFLKEEIEFLATQLLEENFGEKAVFQGVYYSLSYCQGDGAMIEFDLVYYGKNLSIKHDDYCHYYHENSFKIIENNEGLTKKQHEQLHKKIYNINKQLTKYGYSFIEYDRTEQAIDQLKDCMFYENGDIY
jgi:hypothetical protein